MFHHQQIPGFFQNRDLREGIIIGGDEFAHFSFKHQAVKELIDPVPIDVDANLFPGFGLHHQKTQMLFGVLQQQRGADALISAGRDDDKRRHDLFRVRLCVRETLLRKGNGFTHGRITIVVPFPFFAVERGTAENGVDQIRAVSDAEGDHAAQGQIGFRLGAVTPDVARGEERIELLSVFLGAQQADDLLRVL